MYTLNDHFMKLPGNYLFATIAKKIKEYTTEHPDHRLIRLGIGDVTIPLAPAVIDAMHQAVDEMSATETFRGYGPDFGYDFLVQAIIDHDFKSRGVSIDFDEVFVSDGCKSDSGNIGDIFSINNRVAVCDPVYPVYVDSNVMAGRAGEFDPQTGLWSNFIYLPCKEENGFIPEVPDTRDEEGTPDLIYLCFPNNPSGASIGYAGLQKWVDYAKEVGAVILFDAAYEAFIKEDCPHSIFEMPGAKECAIELRSFSKTAGFTGVRCGYTVVPKQLVRDGVRVRDLWARRQATKFNGVSYITQRAAAAIYSPEGQKQIRATIDIYMENARILREGLTEMGFSVSGGINAPYIWMKTPSGMTSWEFFDYLLHEAEIVGTPGSGFGPCGEGYFRLTAFGSKEASVEALSRIRKLLAK
jgi:LL-diaminopimelate aminotransferase